jgi:hypothetical protein
LSFRGRRRGRLSTGSVVSREGAGKHVWSLPDENIEDVIFSAKSII